MKFLEACSFVFFGTIFLSIQLNANERLWKAIKEERWEDAERIYTDDSEVDLSYAPVGEQNVAWYIKKHKKEYLYKLTRRPHTNGYENEAEFLVLPILEFPTPHSAVSAEAPCFKYDELTISQRVRFRMPGFVASAEQGESVTMIDSDNCPGTSIKIRKQSGEEGFVPKVALSLSPQGISKLEDMVLKNPDELCLRFRMHNIVPQVLCLLFENELATKHARGLDNESFRELSPAIALCKSLLKSETVSHFKEGLCKQARHNRLSAYKFLLSSQPYPDEVVVILKSLDLVLSKGIIDVPGHIFLKSFLSLRFLAPMFVNAGMVLRAKTMQAFANEKDTNLLDQLVLQILASELENLEPVPWSELGLNKINDESATLIERIKALVQDY